MQCNFAQIKNYIKKNRTPYNLVEKWKGEKEVVSTAWKQSFAPINVFSGTVHQDFAGAGNNWY